MSTLSYIFFYITLVTGIVWLYLFIRGILQAIKTAGAVQFEMKNLSSPFPKVLVIIPARNEENNIEKCLQSLISQDYPNFEILVVNDASTDRTREIVKEYIASHSHINPVRRFSSVPSPPSKTGSKNGVKITLFNIEDLPQGWCGKTHALTMVAKQYAHAHEWLLFTDADTIHSRSSIHTAVKVAHEKDAEMVSLLPKLKFQSFWEKVLMPSMASLVAFFHPLQKVNNPERKRDAFANGQYIFIKTSTYLTHGGHEPVKESILDDIDLARYLKAKNVKLYVGSGLEVFETRMYGTLKEIINGWKKNFYAIVGYKKSAVLMAILLSLCLPLIPFAGAVLGGCSLISSSEYFSSLYSVIMIFIYLMVLTFQSTLRAVGKIHPHYSVFAPLGGVITAYIIASSAFKGVFSRKVTWKGRHYRVKGK